MTGRKSFGRLELFPSSFSSQGIPCSSNEEEELSTHFRFTSNFGMENRKTSPCPPALCETLFHILNTVSPARYLEQVLMKKVRKFQGLLSLGTQIGTAAFSARKWARVFSLGHEKRDCVSFTREQTVSFFRPRKSEKADEDVK